MRSGKERRGTGQEGKREVSRGKGQDRMRRKGEVRRGKGQDMIQGER